METEQQQVEALQNWWKENGKSVIVTLVIAFGGLGAYSWWQHSVQRNAEMVSIAFQELVNAAEQRKLEEVLTRTDTLITQSPDSAYAGLASLHGAATAHALGDLPAARRLLLWASEHAEQRFVRSLARLRLAHLLLDELKYEEASKMLDRVEAPALAMMTDELKADILLTQSKANEARKAYAKLLEGDLSDADRVRLQEKVDMASSLSDAR